MFNWVNSFIISIYSNNTDFFNNLKKKMILNTICPFFQYIITSN